MIIMYRVIFCAIIFIYFICQELNHMNKNVGSSEQLEEDMAIWIAKHNADIWCNRWTNKEHPIHSINSCWLPSSRQAHSPPINIKKIHLSLYQVAHQYHVTCYKPRCGGQHNTVYI